MTRDNGSDEQDLSGIIDADELKRRLVVVAVIAIAFVAVGTLGPLLFYQHAPADQFYEVHNFTVDNATATDDTLNMTVYHTVHQTSRSEVVLQLSLVSVEDADHQIIQTIKSDVLLEKGTHASTAQFPVSSERIDPGTYRITGHVELQLPYNVNRDVSMRSNEFMVRDANSTALMNGSAS